MAIVIVQQPDSLSLSGNLKELVVQTESSIQVKLSAGSDIVLDETYYPGNGNLVHIDFSDIIDAYMAYSLPSTDIFIQTKNSAAFTVELKNDDTDTTLSFSAIKGGKLHLNESASSFLKGNFLTWQPTQKYVTYYSPEWLTYYAVVSCSIMLKAYWEDGTSTTMTLVSPSAGTCYTVNMQYAVVSGLFGGKRPMYYDVWTEASGARLSYIQRYLASETQMDEHWFLFENSLGGMDSIRAYGQQTDDPEYDYHMARRGFEGENYRIDVERVRSVNTGYLTPEECRWLQDLFAAKKAYVYTASGLYQVILTDGDGSTEGTDEPSAFSFGYRFADTRPYLDIQRRTDLPEDLTIPIPTGETFFLPPRLAELPKQALSADLLIPVEEPHTEAWGTLTAGMLHDAVLNALIAALDGLNLNPTGEGGGQCNITIVKKDDLTLPTDFNVFSSLRTLYEIKKAFDLGDFKVELAEMYLRKDIDDTAVGNILFGKKIGSVIFVDGYEGRGWKIEGNGDALLDSLRVRGNIFLGGITGSPTFASGFTGFGWQIDTSTATGEFDNIFVRKTFTAYEIVYSQIYGLGGSQIVSDINKLLKVENLGDRYRCWIDPMDINMLVNFREGDGVRIQKRDASGSIRYLFGRCIGTNGAEMYFDIANPLISGSGAPQEGDFAMRWGNNQDVDRQGMIYLTSADSGAPFIDIYDGVTDESTQDCLKARLGNLKGIRTQRGDQLNGYGAYLNGIYVENSSIILNTGDTIEQTLVAMNGKFESLINGVREDMSAESGNILRNASFSSNTHYWSASNLIYFIDVNGLYLWMNSSFYVDKNKVADIYNDSGKNVLRLRNTTIKQLNSELNIPTRDENEEEEETYAYSFALFYKVIKDGTLTVGFSDTELYVQKDLTASDKYTKLSHVAQWNEQGDFQISFTGEILIYGVSLFEDSLANAKIELWTAIEQTDEYIKLLATKEYVDSELGSVYTKYDAELKVTAEEISQRVTKTEYESGTNEIRTQLESSITTQAGRITALSTSVDNIENTIETAGWITAYDGNTLWASKEMEDGDTIISYINQTATSTTISSSRIDLYGAVSFSMFNSSLQSDINAIAKNSSNALSKANEALSSFSNLPSWVNEDSIADALAAQTTIQGGFITTEMIVAEALVATNIAATTGTVGGWYIGDNYLSNSSNGAYNGTIANARLTMFNEDNVSNYIELSPSQNTMLTVKAHNKIGVRIFSTSSSGVCLSLTANTGSTAVVAGGGVNWYQRTDEMWNMPGLLAIVKVTSANTTSIWFEQVWGDGVSVSSVVRTGTGMYTINYYTGGSSVYPIFVPCSPTGDEPYTFVSTSVGSSSMSFRSYALNDNEYKARDAVSFYVYLCGRSRLL